MASGVRPDSTDDPPGHGAPEIPPLPLPRLPLLLLLLLLLDLVDFGLLSERYLFLTQRPLPRYDTYRNPLVMVLVTATLFPLSTTPTTDALALGSVRTFRSFVAYLRPITLRDRIGAIVSDADTLGFRNEATSTGGRVTRRLGSCVRSLVSLGEGSSDAVEAGAGYATCGSSPGITAPATPTPRAVTTAVGITIRAKRAACDGRIALRGRGLDTCSQSPDKMRPKRYLPEESKQFHHDCPTPTQGLDELFSSGDVI